METAMTLYSDIDRLRDHKADRAQADRDDQIDAFDRAVERASAEVEIDDVITAMAELPESFRKKVFAAYLDKSDRKYFLYLLELFFDDAFNAAAEGIARRKGY